MSQTASRRDFIAVEGRLLVALELGWKKWRLAFGSEMGQKAWQTVVPARDVAARNVAIGRAKQRLGLSEDCRISPATRRGGMASGSTGCLSGWGLRIWWW